MIKINLQGEKKDMTLVYAAHILVTTGSSFLLVLVLFFMQLSANSTEESGEMKKQTLHAEDTKLSKITKEVEELDNKRKWLADKLTTISRLKAVKQAPVQVLAALSDATPDKAWIKSMNKRGDAMEFAGVALDNQTISLLMKQLEDQPFFDKIDLVFSKQYFKDNVGLKEFSLRGSLTDPLKANEELTAEENKDSKKEEKKS